MVFNPLRARRAELLEISPEVSTRGDLRNPTLSACCSRSGERIEGTEGEAIMLGHRGGAVSAVRGPAGHALRATGVGKRIDEAVLLLPTDVELGTEDCVVLRGPNGSGKTTLLRILAGTMSPSEGEATLDGSPVDERDDSTRNAIAALIGAPATYRDLTLVDHLVLIDSTWGHVGERSETRSDEVLELSRSTIWPSGSRMSCPRANSSCSTSRWCLYAPRPSSSWMSRSSVSIRTSATC
jgi:ABC transporter